MFEDITERIINILTSRLTILALCFVGLFGVLVYRCFTLQIIEGQKYLDNFILEQEKTRDITSSRGNIYDKYGNLLAYNELAYSVKIEDTFESSSSKNANLNSELLQLVNLIEKNGDHITCDFKIYVDEDDNFEFSVSDSSRLRFLADVYDLKSTDDLTDDQITSTALEIMQYLSRPKGTGFRFAVGEYADAKDKDSWVPGRNMTNSEWLSVVAIRYAMRETSYRKYIGTVIATAVSEKTVAVVMENAELLPGVSIEETTVRRYVDSKYFAHLLGYTGSISSEERTALNEQIYEEYGYEDAYSANDVVGKSGIESYMETTLQGQKGYEKVMVDNTGKVISVLERSEPIAGENVYLSIDKNLTIAAYNILEQKLAGLLVAKIDNIKEYKAREGASSSEIRIPIYDVYFSVINNSIVNIKHFESENAGDTEKAVYSAFLQYREKTYNKLHDELYTVRTPYNKLSTEYQVYESNIVSLLTKNGIIMSEKIDANNQMYIDWTTNEIISLGEYLDYLISQNWIDTSKLTLTGQYSSSVEIFDALINEIDRITLNNSEFQKRFYKYMLLDDVITGKQICMLLYEQDACDITIDEITSLSNGKITSYTFMINRIKKLDITPAQLALDPCNGSVVITDVNNGSVLAMVSYPGYDNNRMANYVDADYYEKLLNDKSSPLLNYATQYKAAPGSTFKIVSATAGIMENVIDYSTEIDCVSLYSNITPPARCWNRYGHGDESIITAIRDSCNYYFYEVGYRLSQDNGTYNDKLGLETLYEYADLYGLSEKSGIEIGEYSPEVSDSDAVRSAIGQGTNSYTTVGLARYATTIANSGTVYNLTLLDHTTDANGNITKVFSSEIRNQVELPGKLWLSLHEGMRKVVENKSYFSDLSVNVAGKTGTAEQTKSRPSHALFICYAPYENPGIAMVTRIPFGYSSDYAAQVARDVIKYYYGLAEEEELITGTADTPDAGVSNEM